ncbi:hypothetical protein [Gilvimarinus agarilyticus]|uniref:hypothetical protein n=1 Tax=Gilvimarinus agarilyticus TaxID=679259 RepID=UPI0005A1B224|nr:hypothetical protein [Gilvimarinus agarilyticus]
MTLAPDIADLIPHQAPMVLLDSITHWDDGYILCRALSHTREDNPLRDDGKLSIFAGVEYAAQAMAAHASLRNTGKPARRGVIATASKLSSACQWLDEYSEPLLVRVQLLASNANSSLCQFEITCGANELLRGQLTALSHEA